MHLASQTHQMKTAVKSRSSQSAMAFTPQAATASGGGGGRRSGAGGSPSGHRFGSALGGARKKNKRPRKEWEGESDSDEPLLPDTADEEDELLMYAQLETTRPRRPRNQKQTVTVEGPADVPLDATNAPLEQPDAAQAGDGVRYCICRSFDGSGDMVYAHCTNILSLPASCVSLRLVCLFGFSSLDSLELCVLLVQTQD